MANKYRTFPTTLGRDPNTKGPIAKGKIIKQSAPKQKLKKDVFSAKGAAKKIKSRRALLESIK